MAVSVVLIALGLTVVFSMVLIYQIWGQRSTAGLSASLIAFLMVAVIWWTIFYGLEIVSSTEGFKQFCFRAKFLAIVFIPVFWMLFGLQYTGRLQWMTARRIALLCIFPGVTTLLIWTNELHGLMWTYLGVGDIGGISLVTSITSTWFWVHSAYSYVLIMTASYFLFRQFAGSPGLYRRQLVALLVSVIAPMIANAVTIFGNQPIDYTPFAFAVTGLALTWGLLRFQLLELVPIARNLVVDSMTDGVIVLDAQGRIVDLNPAANQIISGITPDAIGKRLIHVIAMMDAQLDLTRWSATTGEIQDELVIGEGANQRTLDVKLSSLYDSHHKLSGRVVLFRDITDRKLAEQQIRHQNEALVTANHQLVEARKQAEHATQLKSQFLATMSHELRTPLNAVIGYSEIQLMGIAGELSGKQREYQDRILANALHLLGLINDILDLSRIEAGRMDLLLTPFNLQTWLDEIVLQNRVLAEEKQLVIEASIDPRLPEVIVADSERLKQVVINLLSNAVKFTQEGSVKIAVTRNDVDTLKIDVQDTGIGIPIHAQETIFEEFRQVDGSSHRQYGGTGLGLAIVRKLVVMMGGHIRLKSEVGKGSTFTIVLPLKAEISKTTTPEAMVQLETETL
ncbi:MAG: PAS domain-containing protein [Anaerolineaceae bacterium]|nr:PAS domain-containing protein [Anaerolineaceae bacterium]